MQTIYSDQDLVLVKKQRSKILAVFFAVTAAYAIFCSVWLVYHIGLPYADEMAWLPQTMVYVASGAYIIFLFPFMGIKFHRVNKYYKFLYYVSEGRKQEETCYFVCFAKSDLQKDNVDVISCIFKTWNKKKSEWMEREVYFDVEKEWPDLEQGDLVKYIVQSNFLIQYEVLERGALQEEDDEEEYEETEENETEQGAEE
ncbi:MAG: hypothetical protein IJX98_05610 [Clostridia bacterium]|nr:hypothetical protein [Clostridia bacterium]